MTGFSNSIVTKLGQIVAKSIRSPNFQHGVSGWSINKDGSAEFHDVSIPAGSGGTVVTFGPTAPGSPNTGDVWYNTAGGLEASVCTSTSPVTWTPHQIGTLAIGSAAITSALLANAAVEAAHLAPGAVGTPAIANGAVTPAQISALTASLIGQTGGVLNANPYFTGGDASSWSTYNGTLSVVSGGSLPAGAPYAYAGLYTQTGQWGNPYQIVSLPGSASPYQILITMWVHSASTTVWTKTTPAGGSDIWHSHAIAANTWTQISDVVTIPAGATSASVGPSFNSAASGSVYFQGMTVVPQVPGALIQAGTVTTEQLVANLIYAGIIDGTVVNAATFNGSVFNGLQSVINKNGIFYYSGTPAFGNLYIAIASPFGTDQFGNGYPQGISIFGANGAVTTLENNGTAAAVMMLAAGMAHNTVNAAVQAESGSPGGVNEQSVLFLSSGKESNLDDAEIELFSEAADASFQAMMKVLFNNSPVLTISKTEADITVPVVMDQWTNMTLANGWKNNTGFGVARYRKVACPPNSVEIIGALDGTAATNNAFFTLPAGYRPASAQGFPIAPTSAADATNGRCDTSGNLTIDNITMPVAQTFFIHALISLDA